jgi:hypothetical protein
VRSDARWPARTARSAAGAASWTAGSTSRRPCGAGGAQGIARHTPPVWGRERLLTLEERSGALLHELAHALGAPGHAGGADDLLASTPDAARRAGARALAGEPLESPALAALYARPPGELLQSVAVEAWRTFELDRLARLAAAQPLDGPFLRAGDAAGRIFWRDARGREWGFLVVGLASSQRSQPAAAAARGEHPQRAAAPRAAYALTSGSSERARAASSAARSARPSSRATARARSHQTACWACARARLRWGGRLALGGHLAMKGPAERALAVRPVRPERDGALQVLERPRKLLARSRRSPIA